VSVYRRWPIVEAEGAVAGDGNVDDGSGSGKPEQPYLAEAFEVFYRREYRAVVGLAFALSGSRWVAEDVAQDAFVVAHRRWETLVRYDRPGAFVRRVVANLAVSHARRLAAEARALARMASRHGPAIAPLETRDDAFWEAVRRLPQRQCQAMALRYLEDRTVDDIAMILGCAPETVRVHLHRGRAEVARQLGIEEEARP